MTKKAIKLIVWKNGEAKNKKRLITAVTRDLGIWLNVEMVLYLRNLCIMEKSRIFSPKPRVAAGRQTV